MSPNHRPLGFGEGTVTVGCVLNLPTFWGGKGPVPPNQEGGVGGSSVPKRERSAEELNVRSPRG